MRATHTSAGAVLEVPAGVAPKGLFSMHDQCTPAPNPSQEEWRPVPGFDAYEVSSIGRVRRATDSPTGGFRAGHIIRPRPVGKGYLGVSFYRNGKRPMRYIQRLVCEAFHGPPPSPIHQAAHENGIRTDNRADNLRWALPIDNMADAKTHGNLVRGAKSNFSKFSDAEIARVFELKAQGCHRKAIAAELGMCVDYVDRLLNGKARRGHDVKGGRR